MIDDADRLAALDTAQPNAGVLMLLRAAAVHPHLRVVLVCDNRRYQRLEVDVQDLVEQLALVRLERLSDDAVREVVDRLVPAIESKHGVTISAVARLFARALDGCCDAPRVGGRSDRFCRQPTNRAGEFGGRHRRPGWSGITTLAGDTGARS